MKKILNYINGEFTEPFDQKYLDNINPATGDVYSLVPSSNERDVLAAIASAHAAFPAWSKLSVEKRVQYLRDLAQGILSRLNLFAEAESRDNGKPVSLAKTLDIPRSAANFQFFADAITQFHGETFRTHITTTNYTEYSALGVVACISPWNLPLYLLTWKIAPALAAGNTVVAKPSELTPMTAFLLAEVCREINLPPGVLNFVHGLGPQVGAPLVQHPKVKAVSFTGSTVTGRSIAQSISGQFKKVSLEMGGKNPNIIFGDCDFEKTLEMTLRSSFLNQGQICLCGSRIFVEESIYEKFKTALIERIKLLKVGNPFDFNTDQGALVSKAHMEKVLSYIELAKQEGGKILTGGARAELQGECAKGFFVQPTLIENLTSICRTNQEEIFGPVATIMPFKTESEVIAMANSTNYGLAATIWTTHIDKAQRVAQQLESGIVWVNTWMNRDLRTPFGGVKESGYGREGGVEALKFFSEVKNICVQYQMEALP
jgi:aminomuconate-semialdehyde/2-hydroxymuconate-6-semialdehyde dehydrogenase